LIVITISLVIKVQPLDNVSDDVAVGEGVGGRLEGGIEDGGAGEELSSGGVDLDDDAGGALEESGGSEDDSEDDWDEDSEDEGEEEGGGGSDVEDGLDEGGTLGGAELGEELGLDDSAEPPPELCETGGLLEIGGVPLLLSVACLGEIIFKGEPVARGREPSETEGPVALTRTWEAYPLRPGTGWGMTDTSLTDRS